MASESTTMPTSFWQKVETGVNYEIYTKFWNKPLTVDNLKVTVHDDESGMMVDQEFSVLTIINDDIFTETKGKLLVRQEYQDALAAVQAYFDEFPETGAIIVGHPGIGKSWCKFFILVQRLSEGRRTILNKSPNSLIYLFHESGLYTFTGTSSDHLGMDKEISLGRNSTWALLDSPNSATPPNGILTDESAPVFFVYPSSPNDSRYKDLLKQNKTLLHVMDSWSFGEIWAGAKLRREPNHDEQARLHGYFRKYGPSARTLYLLYNNNRTTKQLDNAIDLALAGINMDGLRNLTKEATGHVRVNPSAISHSIILVYPDPEDRSNMLVEVISRHVGMLLADELFKRGLEEMVKTYKMFRDINPLSAGAGWLFEFYCHRMLSEHQNRQIKLVPLTRVTNSQCKNLDGEKVPFKLCRNPDSDSEDSFRITRRQRCYFDNTEDLKLSTEHYFIPSHAAQPTYDGFMVQNDAIYAFQMTKSSKHDVKLSGILELKTFEKPIIFVLLVPKERENEDVFLAMTKEAFGKAEFFMSIIDMNDVL